MKNKNQKLKIALRQTLRALLKSLPVIIGVILLVSLANTIIPKDIYLKVFTGNYLLDPFIGAFLGSILAGNPLTSYVLGGEFLKQGISLLAVTAFLVSWVTVGIVQLPAESIMLGKRFAITRNVLSFVFSIIVAGITVLIISMI